jgi:hypothetical protein
MAFVFTTSLCLVASPQLRYHLKPFPPNQVEQGQRRAFGLLVPRSNCEIEPTLRLRFRVKAAWLMLARTLNWRISSPF